MAKTEWKPWHEVALLRDDLKSGELPLHMFAADLYTVLSVSTRGSIVPVWRRRNGDQHSPCNRSVKSAYG